MEKGSCVKDISGRPQSEGAFLIVDPHQGQGRNGAPYWSLKLVDATGSIDAKIWHPLSSALKELHGGALAHVEGHTSKYRDQLQFVIDKFHLLDQTETASLDMSLFLRASPCSIESMFAELMETCRQEFTHAPWLKLIESIFAEPAIRQAYKNTPAAKSVHHAYAGGLLEHSLNVVKLCRFFADKYAELDRQTLLAGAILHDIGKIRELSGPMNTDYTQEGRLLGHIFLGIQIIGPFLRQSGLKPELCEHLRHLILSHHGELEYGAARLPQTAEAFALHHADNLDAKLAQCRSSLENVSGSGFGAWQSTLNRSIFRSMPTPAAGEPAWQAPMPDEPEAGMSPGPEVSFEDGGKVWYSGEMPPDDGAPMHEDWEIPAETQIDEPLEPAGPSRPENRVKGEESGKQRARQRNGEAQCSLLMRG